MENKPQQFMQLAMELAMENINHPQGGPFGAVIVKSGKIIGQGKNQVIATNDPTAHAEIQAIRMACQTLNGFHLTDCELYTNCEPCPMCLSAIYWARINKIFFAATREDAAKIGFIDKVIYDDLEKPIAARQITMQQLPSKQANQIFSDWVLNNKALLY